MIASIFLARVFGLFFVIMGLAFLIRGKQLRPIVIELISNKASFFLLGLLTVIFGILLILINNIWVAGWPVFITIVCWLIFIMGILRIFFLDKMQQITLIMVEKTNLPLQGTITLIIGLVCLYLGFFY